MSLSDCNITQRVRVAGFAGLQGEAGTACARERSQQPHGRQEVWRSRGTAPRINIDTKSNRATSVTYFYLFKIW
jgi:hypothetical protein